MKDQEKIELVDLINECELLEEKFMELIDKLSDNEDCSQRSLALAKTNLQQGFMWLDEAIDKP